VKDEKIKIYRVGR